MNKGNQPTDYKIASIVTAALTWLAIFAGLVSDVNGFIDSLRTITGVIISLGVLWFGFVYIGFQSSPISRFSSTGIIGIPLLTVTGYGYFLLRQDIINLTTIVFLLIGLGGFFTIFLFVIFRQSKIEHVVAQRSKLSRKSKVRFYSQNKRRLAMGGLVVTLMLTFAILRFAHYQLYINHSITILVADFEGPEPSNYRVTEILLSGLREALSKYNDVRIVTLNYPITEAEGSKVARNIGREHGAAIVLWGWYGVTSQKVPLSINFEILQETESFPELNPELRGRLQTPNRIDLETLSLQTELSDQASYITLLFTGLIRYTLRDYPEAITRFNDAMLKGSNIQHQNLLVPLYVYRGVSNQAIGNIDQAISDYSQAITAREDKLVHKALFAIAYNNRAALYMERGWFYDAINDISVLLLIEPDVPEFRFNLGSVYLQQGDIEQALLSFLQATEMRPNFAEGYAYVGQAYLLRSQVDDIDQAIFYFSKAVELGLLDESYEFLVYSGRGSAYFIKGEHGKAVADYTTAIQIDPSDADIYFNRGMSYSRLRRYQEAIADFTKAIGLNDRHTPSYYYRGLLYALQKDRMRSINDLEMVLKLGDMPGLSEEAHGFLIDLGAGN